MIKELTRNNTKKYSARTILIVIVLAISLLAYALIRSLYNNIEWFLFQQNGIYEYDYTIDFKDPTRRWGFINNTNQWEIDPNFRDPIIQNESIQEKYILSAIELPVQVSVSLANESIVTDVILFAISDDFFGTFEEDTIPVAISEIMLNLYNTQIAEEWILPTIPKEFLSLATLDFNFGKSIFLQDTTSSVRLSGKIERVSGILPVGLVIPESVAYDVVERLWRWTINPYKVTVVADNQEHMQYLLDIYSNQYHVVTNFDYINMVRERISGLRTFFMILHYSIVAILVWFLIYITFSIVEQNKKVFRVLRIHGVSRLQLLMLLWWQVVVYVFFASVLFLIAFWMYDLVLVPKLTTTLSRTYWIDYALQQPSRLLYLANISIHLLLFIFLATIFSYSERNKKFEK